MSELYFDRGLLVFTNNDEVMISGSKLPLTKFPSFSTFFLTSAFFTENGAKSSTKTSPFFLSADNCWKLETAVGANPARSTSTISASLVHDVGLKRTMPMNQC
jgi:hypothetical protein